MPIGLYGWREIGFRGYNESLLVQVNGGLVTLLEPEGRVNLMVGPTAPSIHGGRMVALAEGQWMMEFRTFASTREARSSSRRELRLRRAQCQQDRAPLL